MQRATIVCGFPGVGKSYWNAHHSPEYTSLDLDPVAAAYKWEQVKGKQRQKRSWPDNYMSRVLRHLGEVDVLLLPPVPEVRRGLKEAEVDFVLVYPSLNQKQEYLRRYVLQNKPAEFIRRLNDHFEEYIKEMMTEQGCRHFVLAPNQHLSDVMPRILAP